MLDLDDHVVVELAVERMKVVIRCARTVIPGIGPIEMMVVNKRAIKNDSAMRRKRVCYHVRSIRRCSTVSRRTKAALRIRLDHKARKIRNQPVNLVNFFSPPLSNARICGIERIQSADHFWAAEVHGNG